MLRNLLRICVLVVSTMFIFSCNQQDDDSLPILTVQLVSESHTSQEPLSDFDVALKSLSTAEVYHVKTDASGKCTIALPFGAYHITAEKRDAQGVSTYYAHVDNFTFKKGQSRVSLSLGLLTKLLPKTFVLHQLYFNCSKASEWEKSMWEEFVTIQNVSDRPLYADGWSIAIAGDYNDRAELNGKERYLPDSIVVSQLYTIPGNGKEHLVQPGQSIVIAHSAINHKEPGMTTPDGNVNARDLSGADFEIYIEGTPTVDNPEVPNMDMSKSFSTFQAFQWGYTGYAPMMLVKAETADISKYIAEHLKMMEVTASYGSMKQHYLVLPTSWIVDGVETAPTDFTRKVLPISVDRSKVNIDDGGGMMGGFKSLLVQRKRDSNGSLMDTNDSAHDFEVVPVGNINYPKH